MFKALLVGIGGFVGAILRYAVGGLVHQILDKAYFPYGTMTVNILGCFIIGLLNGIGEAHGVFHTETRLILFVGVLGSFTTFSTFGYESFSFIRDGQIAPAVLNVVVHIVLGLSAVYLGDFVSRLI